MTGPAPVPPDPNRSYNLIFIPQVEGDQSPSRHVGLVNNPEAEFELNGNDGQGVPVGKYRVSLQITDPSPSPRMKSYQARFGSDQSPILVDVQQSPEPLVIDLAKYKGT